MEPITTALAVTKVWAVFEMVGGALLQGAAQEFARPWIDMVNEAILDRTGIKNRQRRKAFSDAYQKAEAALVEEIGIGRAYRAFRLIPRIVDDEERSERLILMMLGQHDERRYVYIGVTGQDEPSFDRFMLLLRAQLFQTKEFGSVVEFASMEEFRQIQKAMLKDLQQLAQTVDRERHALRVMIVDPTDYDNERMIYLKMIESRYSEQDFVGFPDLREQRTPTLLADIYIPLCLTQQSWPTRDEQENSQIVDY